VGSVTRYAPEPDIVDLITGTAQHPIFARAFDRISPLMEREVASFRDELLAGLSGRVVEIGAGNGANFAHYPPTVDDVIAIEPEPFLRAKATERAAGASVPVRLYDAVAEELPLEEASVDAAVTSTVLCTVPDLGSATRELRRVLKPGGELRFLEHVRATNPRKARVQRSLDRPRLWPRLGGGCHCGRDTVAAIETAGLWIEQIRSFDLGPAWLHTNPHVLGIARAP
jgi:ubiquinone/menaquinone biosynthesis C-methylase UbiE